MKLKLEALSAMDGIAIIRSDRLLRLVRPPYRLNDALVLDEDAVQDAILRHGFSAGANHFDKWEDAIDFLNRQTVEARRALGKEIPNALSGKEILDVAPPEVLSSFLDRIEREIIPRRSFDHAENFLLALLSSTAWTREPEIGIRAVVLLRLNKEMRNKAAVGIAELSARGNLFPSLGRNKKDFELSARAAGLIRERGSVFAPAS